MSSTLYNVERYRARARRRLPRAVFDFVDGAAGNESTMRRNQGDFAGYEFRPRVLVDVNKRSLRTSLAGIPIESPILLSPTGMVGMVHPDGERGAVVTASRRGTIAITSSASTYSIEELADTTGCRPWFQLYPFSDDGFRHALVDRVAAAGFGGLCFTVDCPVSGKRERDLAHRMTVRPFRLTASNAVDFARHPRWLSGVLRERRVNSRLTSPIGVDARPGLFSMMSSAGASAAQTVDLLNPSVTWAEFVSLRDQWQGPLAIKGILDPADAEQAVQIGADVIVVSNHGGRQLDGVQSAIGALPAIVSAVAGRADVVLDGGVRRGEDVVKALALGARACMIGRPWLYGLACGGTAGIAGVLETLEAEIHTTLALLGQPDIEGLTTDHVVKRVGVTN